MERSAAMAKKASDHVKYYNNPDGPVIGTVSRNIIERDGLYFKDLDGSGEYRPFDDWRLPAKERAKAYVKVLSTDEKIAAFYLGLEDGQISLRRGGTSGGF